MNAIDILKKYSGDEDSFNEVLSHSARVRDIAIDIAKKVKRKVNLKLISDGALLHDIGRFSLLKNENSALHGILGGRIMETEGLTKIRRICETHVGAGIPKGEAIKAGLPAKDFLPKTPEEKIICYADKLAGHDKDLEKNYLWELERLEKKHGKNAAERLKKLRKDVEKMMI